MVGLFATGPIADACIRALAHPDPFIKRAAMTAVLSAARADHTLLLGKSCSHYFTCLTGTDAHRRDRLIDATAKLIRDVDWELLLLVLDALELVSIHISDGRITSLLTEALQDPSAHVRQRCGTGVWVALSYSQSRTGCRCDPCKGARGGGCRCSAAG